jgi:peptide/nickel transport system substrate-binding protein
MAGGTTTIAKGDRPFSNFRVVYDGETDYLDPGLSYTVQCYEAMWNVYLGLLGYKHVGGPDGATIVPALAEALPTVSADGLTYTLTLRSGLRYSNGKPVQAADFENAIRRTYLLNSPGRIFFEDIVGADQFAARRGGDLTGITSSETTRKITIKLRKPRGDFLNALASLFAAPVPQGTRAEDESTSPIPSTGPYVIESYAPGRQFVLARNPDFVPTENVPATNPDRITVAIAPSDAGALQQVLDGKADYDFRPVPPDRLGELRQQYGDRLQIFTPANTYYFFMNTRLAPFDKAPVRQAVNYAIDRDLIARRYYGGLATPTENILPPTYAAFKKHSLYGHDLAKAKQLVRQAGATGAKVTIWGYDRETSRGPVVYLRDVLKEIGLDARIKIVSFGTYYARLGQQRTNAQIGFASWFQDYPHPSNWFDVLLNGDRIAQSDNYNYANLDDPALNRAIERLRAAPELTDKVNAEWAALDERAMRLAPWAPFVNVQLTAFFGDKVDMGCYVNHVLFQFDLGQICAK